METENQIRHYYNELAKTYDQKRFGNSYGNFLHQQEERQLAHILKLFDPMKILNLGCGTGRFMEYCHFGLDFSEEMIMQAASKYPNKSFTIADAAHTGYPDTSYDLVLSMHTLMHQNKEKTREIFKEVYRILRPGGRFIFDVPSATRRNFTKGHRKKSWHGSNAYTLAEIKETLGEDWDYKMHKGLLMLPLHRIPSSIRPYFFSLDTFLCRNLAADYASYMLIVMQKEAF